MTYDLYIGDQTFSSWSMRGWLMLEKFNIPHRDHLVGLYTGTLASDLAPLAPARLVPLLKDSDGIVVGDTLAMAETLAERHPDARLWPSAPAKRALARWMVAEVHSGFWALRGECPMQLRGQWQGFAVSDTVKDDLDRLEQLWTLARTQHGHDGPWLFGSYSLADVFYAPVAARIAGYGLPVGQIAADYVAQHLSDLAFRRWRAIGSLKTYAPVPYALDLDLGPWPAPAPRAAKAVENGPSVNDQCPYSGKPTTDYFEMDGKVWGFCNPTCRDKTAKDPEAWPAFMAMLDSH